MNGEFQASEMSGTSMIVASILAIVLGFVMLLYPGGTMVLMDSAFIALQTMISIFVLAYAIMSAVNYFKAKKAGVGATVLIIGVAATLLVWIFDVRIVWIVFSAFCILAGLGEILGAFLLPVARSFVILLGLFNLMIGAIVIKYPMALPLLIAWYVLFWGISRLLLAIEIRKLMQAA